MGKRHYQRLWRELPVTVVGTDASGNPFSQTATTVDISARGLRLRGISCLSGRRGEPLLIKYKNQRCRYRVAWIGDAGTAWQGIVGLEALEDCSLLFADQLPEGFTFSFDARMDTYATPPEAATAPAAIADHGAGDRRQQERRRHPRYACSASVQIWEDGQEIGLKGRVNEVSAGGCYVEMMSPLRLGTSVRLELTVKSQQIRVDAVVRTSQPNFGMGLEFTRIEPAEQDKLQRAIAELSGTAPAPVQPAATPEVSAPQPASGSSDELEDRLTRWFGVHDTLSRQEFIRLKQEAAASQAQEQETFSHFK